MTNLHQSLEELSINWSICEYLNGEQYDALATVLIDVLCQCTRLNSVSLAGNILHFFDLEKLNPYGHLFHELEFVFDEDEIQTTADGQAVSNLFATCNNLTKLSYKGTYDEQDALAVSTLHQCPLLEELDLSSFFPLPDSFTLISRNCKHLHKLSISCATIPAANLRDIAALEALKELSFYSCEGLTVSGMATLATMRLSELSIHDPQDDDNLPLASLQSIGNSFVGSTISQTLESFTLSGYPDATAPLDDVQLAKDLAACRHLKKLDVGVDGDGCVFGENGLAGLEALAAGCPLLTDISLSLTVDGKSFLRTHIANLKT